MGMRCQLIFVRSAAQQFTAPIAIFTATCIPQSAVRSPGMAQTMVPRQSSLRVSYWETKLESDGRDVRLARKLSMFDSLCGQWHTMEQQVNLVGQLGHMGTCQGVRKFLSYDGNPGGTPDSPDLGNWAYACCLRHMLSLSPSSDWRVRGTSELNDETTGDILEAIWGLLWHRRTKWRHWRYSVEVRVEVSTPQLSAYCLVLTDLVQVFDSLKNDFLVGSEWPDSKQMARLLI